MLNLKQHTEVPVEKFLLAERNQDERDLQLVHHKMLRAPGLSTNEDSLKVVHNFCNDWTSFIPHHQKRNLVFGLLDRFYKIASTYNAIHSEFMNIKSMLITNGYPKAYIDRCIMKYLNKKHETSVNSFTITPPMTTTPNMRLPYLGEISYEVCREMQRLVHRYAIMPFQFRFIHETNNLKKSFTYKDKQNHLCGSSVVYKLTCTCGSNYIVRLAGI